MSQHSVLLYSGGLDSYCMSLLEKPTRNLYVDYHGQYTSWEVAGLPDPPHGDLIIDSGTLNLGKVERSCDLILPMRNAFLVLTAAYYTDGEIMLAATAGDRSTDKDLGFADKMTTLLRHMWKPQHWTAGVHMTVRLPGKDYTKGEIVRRYLKAGGDASKLIWLASCYDPQFPESGLRIGCGACKACARKWVALKVNGIESEFVFSKDPREYFTGQRLDRIKTGHYRGPLEDSEILEALES